jgi:OTU domain-containing protein 6
MFFLSLSLSGRTCADHMAAHEDDFAPFCEVRHNGDGDDDGGGGGGGSSAGGLPASYAAYVDRVRSSAEWGGHVELRALSAALDRPVAVYSARSPEPLRIGEQHIGSGGEDAEPIRLSYHLSYYALGEHYNLVVPAEEPEG